MDFIVYVVGNHIDVNAVTETFLTDNNTLAPGTLNGVNGYSFKHHPRVTGIFYGNNFYISKVGSGQKSYLKFSEWLVSWSNICLKLCIVYHQSSCEGQQVNGRQVLDDLTEYLEDLVLSKEKFVLLGNHGYCNIYVDVSSEKYEIELKDLLLILD